MRSRSAALAVFLVAAVVALAVVWQLGGPKGPTGPDAPAKTTVGRDGDGAPLAVGDVGTEAEDTQPATEGAARTALHDDPPRDRGAGPLVVVTRSGSGEAVGGCEVAWVLRETGWTQRAALRGAEAESLGDFDLPHRFGVRARTNAEGELRLPRLQGPTLLAVRDGDRFGGALAMPGQRLVRLSLEVDEVLRLAVVDGLQRGCAAVPLAVSCGKSSESVFVWRGATGADGTAVVRHFQLLRPTRTEGERFAVAATVLVRDRAEVTREFDGRPVPSEAVTIELPPTAPLTASLHHRSGAPVLAPLGLCLGPAADANGSGLRPRELDEVRANKPAGDAPFRLPFVGVGVAFEAVVELEGAKQPIVLSPVVTTASTEPLAVQWTLSDRCVVIAAHLFDVDGEPLRDRRLPFVLRGGATAFAGTWTTLSDGRGDVVLPLPAGDAPLQLVLRSAASDASAITAIRLSGFSPGERRDLGSLRLQHPEPIVRGTVTDDLGRPIAAAQVRIECRLDEPGGERSVLDEWSTASTAADGTFSIEGVEPMHPFRVRADAQGHLPQSSSWLTRGAQLGLRLQRVGILKGRIVLPPWLSESSLQIRMQKAGETGLGRVDPVHHQGSFFWLGGLAPGEYVATVEMRGTSAALAMLRDVRIAPGENEDERWMPLDLSGVRSFALVMRYVRRVCGTDRAIRVSVRRQGVSEAAGSATSEPVEVGSGWLDAEGRAEVALAHGGVHDVVLHVHEDGRMESREAVVRVGSVEIAWSEVAREEMAIDVDPKRLDVAVQELARLPRVEERDGR